MARIRTIKPDFYTSDDICALSMPARLLYIATWLEADREGRLKWQPRTWRLRYFPADDIDADAVAAELLTANLLVRYGDGLAYIPSFLEHQIINGREAESKLPDPSDLDDPSRVTTIASRVTTIHPRVTTIAPRVTTIDHDHAACTDGYSFPFPSFPTDQDHLDRTDYKSVSKRKQRESALIDAFDASFWPEYPRKVAKATALKAWTALAPDAALIEQMVAAVRRQRQDEGWQKDGGAYIPHAATWIRGRRWEDAGTVPVAAGPGPTAVDRERERTLEVIREGERLLQRHQTPQDGRSA